MKILITGATGFIGSELTSHLLSEGHSVVVVTRDIDAAQRRLGAKPEFISCDLNKTPLSAAEYKGIEGVVNLAGESIQGRWSEEKKSRILKSRTSVAHNLLKNLPPTVKVLVTASAQGFYGDRGDEKLTEASSAGSGFLAEVCQSWESEFQNHSGARLVILRLGMVIAPGGGAFGKMLPLFKKNLGAVLGDGRQWMSCISLFDLVRIFSGALSDERYEGVVNAVCESPIRNAQFTKDLCQKLKVLRLPPVPAFFLKVGLGEMSDLVLFSTRVIPEKLQSLGYNFSDPDFTSMLDRYVD
jgi:uncharacterized protein (TIGR01777 family)